MLVFQYNFTLAVSQPGFVSNITWKLPRRWTLTFQIFRKHKWPLKDDDGAPG